MAANGKVDPSVDRCRRRSNQAGRRAQPAAEAMPPTRRPRRRSSTPRPRTTAEAPEATGIGKYALAGPGPGHRRATAPDAAASRNDGIDISVPEGTPVKAAENGVVIYAGDGLKEFGNTVLVRHDDGLVTVYGHADSSR